MPASGQLQTFLAGCEQTGRDTNNNVMIFTVRLASVERKAPPKTSENKQVSTSRNYASKQLMLQSLWPRASRRFETTPNYAPLRAGMLPRKNQTDDQENKIPPTH